MGGAARPSPASGRPARPCEYADPRQQAGTPYERAPTAEQVGCPERAFEALPGSIVATAIYAAGHGKAAIGGQTFSVGAQVRTVRHVCPACLVADRPNDDLKADVAVRPWMRSFWALAAITCCPVHGARLIYQCDCGAVLAGREGRLDRCANDHLVEDRGTSVSANELEAARYLMARLDGSRQPGGDLVIDALAETINGLYKAEVMHRRGPWRSFEAVEYATLE